MKLSFRKSLCLLAAGLGITGPAAAQTDFPAKPLRLVIPFAPGGSADLAARVLGQKMGEFLGQPVVSENRAGANSNLGAEAVAKSAPDGYTMLYNTSGVVFNMSLYDNPGYDLMRDFSPVALTATVPQILVVNPSLPVKNLREFIAYVKANSGKLNYPSVGQGNIGHLTTEMFLAANGATAVHVSYNGSAQAYVDLISGRTQFYFGTVSASMGHVKDKRLQAIAVTSMERTKSHPDIPTMNESGMPRFEAGAWQGMLVPARTPAAVIDRLNADVNKALKSPDLLKQFDAQGTQALGSTPQQYGAYLKSELDRWGKIIRDLKLTIN